MKSIPKPLNLKPVQVKCCESAPWLGICSDTRTRFLDFIIFSWFWKYYRAESAELSWNYLGLVRHGTAHFVPVAGVEFHWGHSFLYAKRGL